MSAATPAYMELVDFIASGATPEAIVQFRPSDAVQRRVADLLDRKRDGQLSAEESSELDDFVQIEHLMIMAKARAHQRLQLSERY